MHAWGEFECVRVVHGMGRGNEIRWAQPGTLRTTVTVTDTNTFTLESNVPRV